MTAGGEVHCVPTLWVTQNMSQHLKVLKPVLVMDTLK